MTKDEALKMAIDAFNDSCGLCGKNYEKEIDACKKALAQPAQEPVTCLDKMQSITEEEYYD